MSPNNTTSIPSGWNKDGFYYWKTQVWPFLFYVSSWILCALWLICSVAVILLFVGGIFYLTILLYRQIKEVRENAARERDAEAQRVAQRREWEIRIQQPPREQNQLPSQREQRSAREDKGSMGCSSPGIDTPLSSQNGDDAATLAIGEDAAGGDFEKLRSLELSRRLKNVADNEKVEGSPGQRDGAC